MGKSRREAAQPRRCRRRCAGGRTTPPTTASRTGSRRSWIVPLRLMSNPGRPGRAPSAESHSNTPMRFAICSASRSIRGRCCRRTNRHTASTPTPTRSRFSRRCSIAISPRRRRSPASPSAIRRFLPAFERYTALSRTTRTRPHGFGRPTGSARSFRSARAAGSPRATTFRSTASTSSRFDWSGPTPA